MVVGNNFWRENIQTAITQETGWVLLATLDLKRVCFKAGDMVLRMNTTFMVWGPPCMQLPRILSPFQGRRTTFEMYRDGAFFTRDLETGALYHGDFTISTSFDDNVNLCVCRWGDVGKPTIDPAKVKALRIKSMSKGRRGRTNNTNLFLAVHDPNKLEEVKATIMQNVLLEQHLFAKQSSHPNMTMTIKQFLKLYCAIHD